MQKPTFDLCKHNVFASTVFQYFLPQQSRRPSFQIESSVGYATEDGQEILLHARTS